MYASIYFKIVYIKINNYKCYYINIVLSNSKFIIAGRLKSK